jgi:protein gp37
MGQPKYARDFLDGAVGHPDTLMIPMGWTKPRTVFVNSMSDLFHKDLPFEFILQVIQTIQLTPQHTYLVLTKRPERAREFWEWMRYDQIWTPPANLWLGTSCNDQESANKRVPILLKIWGVLRFLSYEPATGPVDLTNIDAGGHMIDALAGVAASDNCLDYDHPRLRWVIMGGESGPKAVPMDPAWTRKVRDDCRAAGVPFFFKQWGLWQPFNGSTEPGREYKVKRFADGRQAMYKTSDKSYNVLDGEQWQQFPTI